MDRAVPAADGRRGEDQDSESKQHVHMDGSRIGHGAVWKVWRRREEESVTQQRDDRMVTV